MGAGPGARGGGAGAGICSGRVRVPSFALRGAGAVVQMLAVHIPSAGPETQEPRQSPGKGHMVFRVEVLCRGRRHTVPRRYGEFHALHKRLKKLYKVPDFPSKRLSNWRTRGLEQRRQGLEAYIQHLGGVRAKQQQASQRPACAWLFCPLAAMCQDVGGCCRPLRSIPGASSQLYHRPVISFCMDPYTCIPFPEPLPNMVVNGVLQGLYDFSASTAEVQPEAPCHSAALPQMACPVQRPLGHLSGQSYASAL
ncbi:hypothetical protein MC885_009720 [Smutsia gigantea]|nr:hypothetical protein MC885_009720 [Smutsia gigantea]